ncbi:MAG: chitobiase/beta-hexosaminidase C-terminal domain-containing protein [Oscillospiraceae bacterium]|nr:chitobiase/beta-hexosaminidase C-terminal domain-containing protein [Oscillospiraceae bacterium]
MKNKILALLAAVFVSVSAFSTPVQQSIGAYVTAQAATSVKTPTANKASGTYTVSGKLGIKLSCKTSGAKIYYSTNGGKSYKLYSKTISISKNTTIKFYAVKNGIKSKVVSRTYKLTPKFTITPNAGKYEGTQIVKLKSGVSGVKFYYTLDGSKPTTKSSVYDPAKGIVIDESCKLRIRTSKSGWTTRYVTKSYTIEQSVIEAESILEDYTEKYAYNTLTAKQKKLYKAVYDGVSELDEKIDVYDLGCSEDDIRVVFYAVAFDNPQFFWLKTECDYSLLGKTLRSVSPAYLYTKSKAASITKDVEKAAQKIINEALKKDDLFERVLYIHDTIVNMTKYISDGENHIRGVNGPLLNGEALCEGYAKTFAYLCQSIGIEAVCISGKSGGDHMWNIVKLDGEWYQMDVTFDDPTNITACEHTYFCITTEQILKDHKLDNPFSVPDCTATEYSYFEATGTTLYTNVNEAYEALVKQAAANFKKGILTTEIICDEVCVKKLFNLIGNKERDIFADLETYGVVPASARRSYIGTSFKLELVK